MPARAPGEPSVTSCTSAPAEGDSRSDLLRSGSRSRNVTPRYPRATRPSAFSCGRIARAWLIGIAKPMLRALRLIAAFMPITSPRALISGPPLLPKLIAASVWM